MLFIKESIRMKAVSLDEIRRGPENHLRPEPPWTIKSTKKQGVNPGFQIKDAAGKKWVIKLDPPIRRLAPAPMWW